MVKVATAGSAVVDDCHLIILKVQFCVQREGRLGMTVSLSQSALANTVYFSCQRLSLVVRSLGTGRLFSCLWILSQLFTVR